jgi:type IV pilus assembly protein PilZ
VAEAERGGRPGVLSLNIKERTALYSAYMPQVRGGGLFIPTNKPYHIGDEIYMLLTLLEDPVKIPVAGHVIWVTPAGAQGSRTQGIGVKFSEDESGAAARGRIESLLGGMLQSNRQTHTF